MTPKGCVRYLKNIGDKGRNLYPRKGVCPHTKVSDPPFYSANVNNFYSKAMDIRQLSKELQAKRKAISELFRRRLPVQVGAIAKEHYQDNFRKGGFVNNGLKKWKPAKRLEAGGQKAADNYGTLLSRRNHLFSNIRYIPGDGRVKVCNLLVYAPAHQWGETLHPTVTPQMRRFAWAKYYEAGGGGEKAGNGLKEGNADISDEAAKWKGLALTKKTKLNIKLPARPMIGESAELNIKINEKSDSEVRKILNS